MPTNPLVSLPPVGPLYGAFYFGAVLCTAFYGVTCMQTFFYYVHYPNDPIPMKSFVALLWVLDSIHEALSIAGVYKYLLAGLMNRLSYTIWNPELVLRMFFTVTVAIPAQGFLAYQIYLFTKKNVIAPLLWFILALLQIVVAIVYVAKALYTENGVQVVSFNVFEDTSMTALSMTTLSAAAAADILIAICLTFLLVHKWIDVGFSRRGHLLQHLVLFGLNTGIWTATFAILTVILAHVYPSNALYTVTGIPLCPLYCNTILANLNGRKYASGETDTELIKDPGLQSRGSTKHRQQNSGEDTFVTPRHGIWKTEEVLVLSDIGGRQNSM